MSLLLTGIKYNYVYTSRTHSNPFDYNRFRVLNGSEVGNSR